MERRPRTHANMDSHEKILFNHQHRRQTASTTAPGNLSEHNGLSHVPTDQHDQYSFNLGRRKHSSRSLSIFITHLSWLPRHKVSTYIFPADIPNLYHKLGCYKAVVAVLALAGHHWHNIGFYTGWWSLALALGANPHWYHWSDWMEWATWYTRGLSLDWYAA